jgi:uncharacterized protein
VQTLRLLSISTQVTKKLLVAIAFTGVTLVGCAAPGGTFPEFTAPVVDSANVVSPDVEAAVNAELQSFRTAGGPQIAVAVVNSTGNATIEDYTIDLANQWGVGDQAKDDGVVILIAVEDRALRIEVGSGVEGDLTDVTAGNIVDQVMVPLLRADNFDAAVTQGAQAVMKVWRGETLPAVTVPPTEQMNKPPTSSWVGIIFFFLFIGVIGSLVATGKMSLPMLLLLLSSGNNYGGGRRSGGFGGGGFGGGGGGGFSGGGASGNW